MSKIYYNKNNFTVAEAGVLHAPKHLSARGLLSPDRIRITWKGQPNVTSYVVESAADAAFTSSTTTETVTGTTKDFSLSSFGAVIYFRVKPTGTSLYSTIAVETKQRTALAPVTVIQSDKFVDSTESINGSKWTIVNPNPESIQITQHASSLQLVIVTQSVSTTASLLTNYAISNASITSGTITAKLSRPQDNFVLSAFGLYQNSSNYAIVYGGNPNLNDIRIKIVIGGSEVYNFTSSVKYNNRVKIQYLSGQVTVKYWSGSAWTTIGSAQTVTLTSPKAIMSLEALSGSITEERYFFENYFMTNADFTTITPPTSVITVADFFSTVDSSKWNLVSTNYSEILLKASTNRLRLQSMGRQTTGALEDYIESTNTFNSGVVAVAMLREYSSTLQGIYLRQNSTNYIRLIANPPDGVSKATISVSVVVGGSTVYSANIAHFYNNRFKISYLSSIVKFFIYDGSGWVQFGIDVSASLSNLRTVLYAQNNGSTVVAESLFNDYYLTNSDYNEEIPDNSLIPDATTIQTKALMRVDKGTDEWEGIMSTQFSHVHWPVIAVKDGYTYVTQEFKRYLGSKNECLRYDNTTLAVTRHELPEVIVNDAYKHHARTVIAIIGNYIFQFVSFHSGNIEIMRASLSDMVYSAWHSIYASEVGYLNVMVTDSYAVIYVRNYEAISGKYYNAVIFKSSDLNLNSWSRIDLTYRTLPDRHYVMLPADPQSNGEWWLHLYRRVDENVNYYDRFLLITSDFNTFRNVYNTYRKTAASGELLTSETELNNYRYLGNGSTSGDYKPSAAVVTDQQFYTSYIDNGAGACRALFYNNGWRRQDIPIPDLNDGQSIPDYGVPSIRGLIRVGDYLIWLAVLNTGEHVIWQSDMDLTNWIFLYKPNGICPAFPSNLSALAADTFFITTADLNDLSIDINPNEKVMWDKLRKRFLIEKIIV